MRFAFEGRQFPSELELTQGESYQIKKRGECFNYLDTFIKKLQALPDLRDTIISDPFSKHTHDLIEEQLPVARREDILPSILYAAIVAETEGQYELNFDKLSVEKRREKLYEQIYSSAEMTIMAQKFLMDNLAELDEMSDEELYKKLCYVVFGSNDLEVIRTEYSLSQRRGFRLGVVNMLVTRKEIKNYRCEIDANPQAFFEKYFKMSFKGKIKIEYLPIGFIVYLEETDYALVHSDDRSVKNIKSDGVVLFYSSLPRELRGRMAFINIGNNKSKTVDTKRIEQVKTHEIRHIIFEEFHARHEMPSVLEVAATLDECKTVSDYENISRAIYEDFVEQAKDEIIAYFSEGEFGEFASHLRLQGYDLYIDGVKDYASKKSDLSGDDAKNIVFIFEFHRKKCFEVVRKIRFIAERLYNSEDATPARKIFADFHEKHGVLQWRDVAEALLRNTPGTKIHRLASYAGMTEKEVKSGKIIKEKDKQIINRLSKLCLIPEGFDSDWWDGMSSVYEEMQIHLPIESLPVLLNMISALYNNNAYWLNRFVLILKDYSDVHGFPTEQLELINELLNKILRKISDDETSVEIVSIIKKIMSKSVPESDE
jgi:hypothetical protein